MIFVDPYLIMKKKSILITHELLQNGVVSLQVALRYDTAKIQPKLPKISVSLAVRFKVFVESYLKM